MVNPRKRVILVAGATGQQGGATARQLLADGWRVRALTRDAGKREAKALAELGAEVVEGDMEDPPSLWPVLSGVYGVFSVQNFWQVGSEAEVRQGRNLADAAHAALIAHFVYSSVGGAERNTGIAHFESKWEIEEHIRSLGFPATILRPAAFMENFNGNMRPQRKDGVLTISLALPADRGLQLIAVDDVGAFAALAFGRPEAFKGRALEIAGDEPTLPGVAELLGETIGEAVRYEELSLEQVRTYSADLGKMFEWFQREGYQADIPALRGMYPGLKTFKAWLSEGHLRRAGITEAQP